MANDKSILRTLLQRFAPFYVVALAVIGLVWPAIRGAWQLAVWLFYLPLNLALASPIGTWLGKRTHEHDPIRHLADEAHVLAQGQRLKADVHAEKTGEAPDREERITWHFALGERQEAAQLIVPREKYPTLWARVPLDLRRNLVQDGRLVNGEAPAPRLAGSTITEEFVARAWRSSTLASARAGWIVFVTFALFSVSYVLTAGKAQYERAGQQMAAAEGRATDLDARSVAARYQDVWSPEDAQKLIDISKSARPEDHAASASGKTAAVVGAIATLAGLLLGTLVLAGAVGRFTWIGRLRWLVHSAANGGVAAIRQSWREPLQRWRWRLEQREMEAEAYASQVNFVTEVDRSPVVYIGESLGVLEFRGHLLAAPQATPVVMSIHDLLLHCSVSGGSGEGKSRNFYLPFVRQLLQLRKQGYPIAIYGTDDKCAIGPDVVQIAKEVGIPAEDVITIGTGPDDWRVDLLEGLSPSEFADIVRSVSAQAGGDGAGDDFWPSMAADHLLNVATVLQVAEFTDAGQAWVLREGRRMYSILNILRTASSDQLTAEAVDIVVKARDDEKQYGYIQQFDTIGLRSAIDYLLRNWLPMVDSTKDGIRANARKALRGFAVNEAIINGFADGAGLRLLPASELLTNKIKLIQISQIEHGSAGRMVNIMLKTLFFKLARAREQADPAAAKARLSWWFNPKLNGLTPQLAEALAVNIFLADEYQALVTVSQDDPISDSSVWNVLRSAGVAGVLLTQGASAYIQAVGDKAAANMRQNWRTQIILRTEDPATIDHAQKLAGKVMRFQAADWGHLESSVAVRREVGVQAEKLPAAQWKGEFDSIPALMQPGYLGRFTFAEYENAFDIDQRFVPSAMLGDSGSRIAQQAALQAAHWRQEDRTWLAMTHGVTEVEAVRAEDLMSMGRARALVFVQRGGGTRVEFVKLPS